MCPLSEPCHPPLWPPPSCPSSTSSAPATLGAPCCLPVFLGGCRRTWPQPTAADGVVASELRLITWLLAFPVVLSIYQQPSRYSADCSLLMRWDWNIAIGLKQEYHGCFWHWWIRLGGQNQRTPPFSFLAQLDVWNLSSLYFHHCMVQWSTWRKTIFVAKYVWYQLWQLFTGLTRGKPYQNSGLTSKADQEQEWNCEWDIFSP